MGTRSRAERDAVTVEIGYALAGALFAAGVVFGAIAGSGYALELPHPLRRVLLLLGGGCALVVFVWRTVHVLWRFPHGYERGPRQPSQPGRTSPDS
ncbi:hypothetical protein GCM10010331_47200 [Streptomyces xanthochromogenes]|uniref:DUF6332 family protein n=1 Tax=Streptomyces xanthochromogenes TaxID=67384 RepID=UPI00167B4E3F|nr:DUF6332 family protein [Streptomyces xanthochromogenes]GHB54197.1 hypothetical protein GCM10010331_47200 [Streptomyces xanthochromogenes]